MSVKECAVSSLKYLQPKRVHGRDYLYFRHPSGRLTPLPTDQNSEAFRSAYEDCIKAASMWSKLNGKTDFDRMTALARGMVKQALLRSRLRQRKCDINEGYLLDLLQQQGLKCALTGIPFKGSQARPDPFAPSIDRIDSSRGYVRGNVRIICLAMNIAREEVFAEIAAAYFKHKEESGK